MIGARLVWHLIDGTYQYFYITNGLNGYAWFERAGLIDKATEKHHQTLQSLSAL